MRKDTVSSRHIPLSLSLSVFPAIPGFTCKSKANNASPPKKFLNLETRDRNDSINYTTTMLRGTRANRRTVRLRKRTQLDRAISLVLFINYQGCVILGFRIKMKIRIYLKGGYIWYKWNGGNSFWKVVVRL